MDFEWNPKKHTANIKARGFGFDFAAGIFAGDTLEAQDTRKHYGEVRMRAIGATPEGAVLHVVYTDRPTARRIISARVADRKERKAWHDR